ncbi:Uncharacterised protein [uncultured archaeon]|nr:Uncharacterised protein [uncultured archaeon]
MKGIKLPCMLGANRFHTMGGVHVECLGCLITRQCPPAILNDFKLDDETLTFFYAHIVEGKCVECGQKFPYKGCPDGLCPKCGKECHERVMDNEDGGEWDTCDYNCPYGPKDDEIDYEKLEKDYPPPSDEEIKKALLEQ